MQDSVKVTATVTSAYVITGVSASIGGVTMPLTNTAGTNTWSATLDISGVGLGPVTLQVAATDANGESATTTVALKHDHAPVLNVLTPDYTVGTPTIRLQATCSDGDAYPCASITAGSASTASATLDQTVSFAANANSAVTVTFTATDTAGLTATRVMHFYGPPDPALVVVEEAPGRVLDVDSTRVLFVNEGGVQVKNRTTGAITVLGPAPTPSSVAAGHLSSVGAIWTGGDSVNGTYTARSNDGFRAHGDWAAWGGYTPGYLKRENLATGDVVTLRSGAGVYDAPDVDAVGNAAYSLYDLNTSQYQIHVVSPAGVDTTPTNGSYPAIDGSNVVFSFHRSDSSRAPVHLLTGGGVVSLDDSVSLSFVTAYPYIGYRANDGWVAYTKIVGATSTAWTRSPAGTEALACSLANVGVIDGVNASGEVVVTTTTAPNTRYISKAGSPNPSPALPFGAPLGEMRTMGADWYELIGRDVLRVDRTGGDAGVDAGAGDAGSGDGGVGDGDGGADLDAGVPPSGGGASSGGSSGAGGATWDGGPSDGATDEGADSGGCSVASATTTGPLFMMIGVGLLGLVRRRARRAR